MVSMRVPFLLVVVASGSCSYLRCATASFVAAPPSSCHRGWSHARFSSDKFAFALKYSSRRDEDTRIASAPPDGTSSIRKVGADASLLLKSMSGAVVLSMVLLLGTPEAAMGTGFGPSGATMSPPRDVMSRTTSTGQSSLRSQHESQGGMSQVGSARKELEDRSRTVGPTKQLDEKLTQFVREEDEDEETRKKEPRISGYERSASVMTPEERRLEDELVQTTLRAEFIERLESQPYWFDYFAAFTGSITSTMVMHPLDTIKTRLQARGASNGNNDNETDDALMDDLYQGLSGNIMKEGPSSALSLSVYEFVKLGLLRAAATAGGLGPGIKIALSRFQVYLLAGAAGELAGSVIQAPAEVIKSLLQSRRAETPTEALGIVVNKPQGVVRAWSAAIWRDVPFSAIQLCVFELVKAYILSHPDTFNGLDSGTLGAESLIGAFAGACGALLTNPSDVVTARIITQQQQQQESISLVDSNATSQEPLGVVDMAKLIHSEGGLEAFFVGWQARVGYWAPAISIFLTTYCSIRQAGLYYHFFD